LLSLNGCFLRIQIVAGILEQPIDCNFTNKNCGVNLEVISFSDHLVTELIPDNFGL